MTPEQQASAVLFGDPEYTPNKPDHEFILGNTLVTYTDLVERYRKQENGGT